MNITNKTLDPNVQFHLSNSFNPSDSSVNNLDDKISNVSSTNFNPLEKTSEEISSLESRQIKPAHQIEIKESKKLTPFDFCTSIAMNSENLEEIEKALTLQLNLLDQFSLLHAEKIKTNNSEAYSQHIKNYLTLIAKSFQTSLCLEEITSKSLEKELNALIANPSSTNETSQKALFHLGCLKMRFDDIEITDIPEAVEIFKYLLKQNNLSKDFATEVKLKIVEAHQHFIKTGSIFEPDDTQKQKFLQLDEVRKQLLSMTMDPTISIDLQVKAHFYLANSYLDIDFAKQEVKSYFMAQKSLNKILEIAGPESIYTPLAQYHLGSLLVFGQNGIKGTIQDGLLLIKQAKNNSLLSDLMINRLNLILEFASAAEHQDLLQTNSYSNNRLLHLRDHVLKAAFLFITNDERGIIDFYDHSVDPKMQPKAKSKDEIASLIKAKLFSQRQEIEKLSSDQQVIAYQKILSTLFLYFKQFTDEIIQEFEKDIQESIKTNSTEGSTYTYQLQEDRDPDWIEKIFINPKRDSFRYLYFIQLRDMFVNKHLLMNMRILRMIGEETLEAGNRVIETTINYRVESNLLIEEFTTINQLLNQFNSDQDKIIPFFEIIKGISSVLNFTSREIGSNLSSYILYDDLEQLSDVANVGKLIDLLNVFKFNQKINKFCTIKNEFLYTIGLQQNEIPSHIYNAYREKLIKTIPILPTNVNHLYKDILLKIIPALPNEGKISLLKKLVEFGVNESKSLSAKLNNTSLDFLNYALTNFINILHIKKYLEYSKNNNIMKSQYIDLDTIPLIQEMIEILGSPVSYLTDDIFVKKPIDIIYFSLVCIQYFRFIDKENEANEIVEKLSKFCLSMYVEGRKIELMDILTAFREDIVTLCHQPKFLLESRENMSLEHFFESLSPSCGFTQHKLTQEGLKKYRNLGKKRNYKKVIRNEDTTTTHQIKTEPNTKPALSDPISKTESQISTTAASKKLGKQMLEKQERKEVIKNSRSKEIAPLKTDLENKIEPVKEENKPIVLIHLTPSSMAIFNQIFTCQDRNFNAADLVDFDPHLFRNDVKISRNDIKKLIMELGGEYIESDGKGSHSKGIIAAINDSDKIVLQGKTMTFANFESMDQENTNHAKKNKKGPSSQTIILTKDKDLKPYQILQLRKKLLSLGYNPKTVGLKKT